MPGSLDSSPIGTHPRRCWSWETRIQTSHPSTLGGSDGKPFFQAGPYDDVDRILAKLMKAVGPDGFTYLLPIDDPEFDDLVEFAPRDTIEFDDE